jgi:phosphoserine phosphatase RsbU/P
MSLSLGTIPPPTNVAQQRLDDVVHMMREISRQHDPQQMVRAYSRWVNKLVAVDGSISLSRRELEPPRYRITRSSLWDHNINPWNAREKVIYDRGILGQLIYADQPRLIDDLQLAPDDPAHGLIQGNRSLAAIPLYDQGVALNMVVLLRKQPHGFAPEQFPELVWTGNLFGRATHNLVLSQEIRRAHDEIDREMKTVADLQRDLLPSQLPQIPNLQLAAHYQTSRHAGGDWYDFFPLPDGRWGIMIADVSGHGTPAAVLMAITHSIAHTCSDEPAPPSKLLNFLNHHLASRYTRNGNFVTAFYGIYDPRDRTLAYACAGHHPPRIRRCKRNTLDVLDEARRFPLGIDLDERYTDHHAALDRGDTLVLYTDGITESRSPDGDFFGPGRLDQILSRCSADVDELLRETLAALDTFTASQALSDDRTLLLARSV